MSDSVNPSAALASNVVDCLIEAGLLRTDKKDALAVKIASGTMKGQDWKLEIDLASAAESKA